MIIGTDGNMGYVYAFERATGAVRWKYKVNARRVASDVVRLGDKVYAVTLGNELLCFNLASGKTNWTFYSGYSGQDIGLTCSSPIAADDRVYFGGLDGFGYALNAQTGELIWKRDLGARIMTSAAIHGRDLYMGTANRHIYRLDSTSGQLLSEFVTESAPSGHLLMAGDFLLAFLGGEVLVSLDLPLREIRWSAEASKEWTSARPYLWHDTVLVGNRRELVALRAADGTRMWSHLFSETVRGIGTSSDVLYVGTLKGPIFAYSPMPRNK